MVSLKQFLNHILPNEGIKCWVAIRDKVVRQGFTASIDELAQVLEGIDARKWNAYMACAAYGDNSTRSQRNALCAQSFWLDIDAGAGKPYPDAEAATAALDAFCEAANLPLPTVVMSGYGVHAWWTLERAITAEEWKRGAVALKRITEHYGLQADPVRTADIASILRPVQTFNWKNPNDPKAVICEDLMPVIPVVEWFASLGLTNTDAAPATIEAPFSLPGRKPNLPVGNDIAAAAMNISEPSVAVKIAEHCAQLRHFRDSKGTMPEPLWYAGLCVLAHCEDGEKLAHEWSSGDPRYSYDDTARKLEHARADSGPTRCDKFQSLNPEKCKGCPHQIASPIVLGRGCVVAPAPVVMPEAASSYLPELPGGFKWGRNYELMETAFNPETEKVQTIIISASPLYLVGVRRAETRKNGYGYIFKYYYANRSEWDEFELTGEEWNGPGWIGKLASFGVTIRTDAPAHRGLRRYVNAAHELLMNQKVRDEMRYDQFGWKEDKTAFFHGETLYRNTGVMERARGEPNVARRAEFMKPRGTFAGWQHAIMKCYAPGWEAQGLTSLAGFAAVLMPFVAGTEGGSVLSLVTNDTGRGKTTALAAALSPWGAMDATQIGTSDTITARFGAMGVNGNLPIGIDEYNLADPALLQQEIQWFTVGRDKARANRDGTVGMNTRTWQTILITTGNKSLVDMLSTGAETAQAARIFEIDAEPAAGTILLPGNRVSIDLLNNCGHAGPMFLKALLQPADVLPKLIDAMNRYMDFFAKRLDQGPTSEMRYVIRFLSVCRAAGALLNHAGIIPHNTGRIIDWALLSAVERRNGRVVNTPAGILAQLINQYHSNCLTVDGEYRPKHQNAIIKEPTRGIGMRYEVKSQQLYISAEFARTALQDMRVSYSHVLKNLEAIGVIVARNKLTTLGAGTNYAGGRVNCWQIDMTHPSMCGAPREAMMIAPMDKKFISSV